MNKIPIAGLIIILAGFFIGFSEPRISYWNPATLLYQNSPNPITETRMVYPNSWIGTVVCVVGILVLLTPTLLQKKFKDNLSA